MLVRWMLTVCWSLFGLVWLVGAIYNRRHSPPVKRQELPVSWIGGALLYLLIRYVLPASWLDVVVWSAPWMTWLGVAMLAGSTGFTLYSRAVLGTMWSSEPNARTDHELRTSGAYAVTRNPIYTGLLGMLFGSACLCGGGAWLFAGLGAIGIFRYKISLEEKLMRDTFGAEYDAYMQRTPRLVPGLHCI